MKKGLSNGQYAVICFMILTVCGILFYMYSIGTLDKVLGLFTVETVYITGMNKELTIDHPYKVELLLEGNGNEITISSATKIKKVDIRGDSNIVELCTGVHDPKIETFGNENLINYLEC